MADSRYIHGTTPEEQARLALLNDLLNGACLRELAVRPGERILDVGCGLGHLGRAMARAAGGRVPLGESFMAGASGAVWRGLAGLAPGGPAGGAGLGAGVGRRPARSGQAPRR